MNQAYVETIGPRGRNRRRYLIYFWGAYPCRKVQARFVDFTEAEIVYKFDKR